LPIVDHLHGAGEQHFFVADFAEQATQVGPGFGGDFVGEFVFVVAMVEQLTVTTGEPIAGFAVEGEFFLEWGD
jgi:hypothetical protein